MKRLLATLFAAGTLFASVGNQPALAQMLNPQLGVPPTTPYQGPAVSPYLNLFRRDTLPAVNYYGIVRPQFEFNNSLQQLQGQALQTRQEVNAEAEQLAPSTGHPVQFQNQGRYFQTINRPTVLNAPATTIFRPRPMLPATGVPTGYPVPIR